MGDHVQQQKESQSAQSEGSEMDSGGEYSFVDNRPEAIQMKSLQTAVNNSPRVRGEMPLFSDSTSEMSPVQRKGIEGKAPVQRTEGEGSEWMNADGKPKWPPNDGFDGNPEETTLEVGAKVDRYGYDGGRFLAPSDTPYEARALAPGTESKPYTVFEVLKPIPAKGGKIAPWFGAPGGGIQYRLDQRVSELLESEHLKKV